MNITVIGPTHPYKGGISHFTTILVTELKKKHQVTFYSFSREYPKLFFKGKNTDTSKEKITTESIKILDWKNPKSWKQVVKRIKLQEPDLVIFPWWVWFWGPMYIYLANQIYTRSKILFICHNAIDHETSWWKKCITHLVLLKGHCLITHSTSDHKLLTNKYPNKKVIKAFHPTFSIFVQPWNKSDARKHVGLNENYILFFGHVRPYKGLKNLIHAMPLIRKKLNISLLIAGEFWEDVEEYRKLISSLQMDSDITIHNRYIPNEEVSPYFAAADIVVLPYESATGTGITQIAFAHQKPVIASNVGDLSEVVENMRRGIIVSKPTPTNLANSIIKCYQEELITTFSKNIRTDSKLFSWNNYLNVIEQTVA